MAGPSCNEQGMSRLAQYVLWCGAAAAVIFLVWFFSNVVSYILVSAVLAIIGKPLVSTLTRIRFHNFHIPKWVAAMLTLAMIWLVAVVFFTVFIPLVFGKISELSTLEIPKLIQSFHEPLMGLQNFIQRVFSVSQSDFSLTDALARQLASFLNFDKINAILSSIVSIISSTVVAAFSISFITFFFLKEDHLFFDMVVAIFPKRYEGNITRALNSITNLLMRYFTGILIESTLMMLIISIALILWGLRPGDAFFIGLVMGVLNVVPYIGPLIGAGISIFVGILHPMEWATAGQMILIIGGTLLACKGFDDFVIQPTLYSTTSKAHPLEIFIVILIAGTTAGVLGMLLAIPSYNVVRVLAKEFFNHFRLVRELTKKI